MKKIDRTGEINYNKYGSLMVITNYRSTKDMDVYFEEYNWTKTNVNYSNFKKGNVICPYEKTILNVGYLGEGKYNVSINGKHTKYYDIWQSMLTRAYDSKYHDKEPTYIDCEVYHEWHNFQTFGEWVEKNFYEIEGERMALDKDILCKGNKIYSPNTCIFVPNRINLLFTKSDGIRGDLPIGVVYDKSRGKYMSYCNVNGRQKHLGRYKTPEEAFYVYKNFKEQYIKKVAEEYKDKIPSKLYNAMIKYEIEIDD